MPSRLVADALTLITLGLFGQLGQVNGVFVTHCDVWSVWIAVSRCKPGSKARQISGYRSCRTAAPPAYAIAELEKQRALMAPSLALRLVLVSSEGRQVEPRQLLA